jgi:tRNA(Arg) A34 adenosine deaminase TadA
MTLPWTPMMNDGTDIVLLDALLTAIEEDIIPITAKGVKSGNKIFGAALLRKTDFSVVLAETNNETENPLWHGEVHALKRLYEIPSAVRPNSKDLIFLSTHEPCSMCRSAITWAGFDNFYYFFSHEDSRDAFAIPHDLRILKEVFNLAPGEYRSSNDFWKSHSILEMAGLVSLASREPLLKRASSISSQYADLSNTYQNGKHYNQIPLS